MYASAVFQQDATRVTFRSFCSLVSCDQNPDGHFLYPVVDKSETVAMARILWVEDDFDVRSIVEEVMLDEGYAIDAAATVAEGEALLSSGEYDLLLTDGRLPDGIGLELVDQAAERGIPGLIITGYAFILRELATDPTRYDVLLKPLRPVELVEAVRTRLQKHVSV